METFDLSGRVAVVSGAGSASGIGFATATLLGQMGAKVVIGGTTPRIERRAAELRLMGIPARAVMGDLTVPRDATSLVDTAISEWGQLDVVVNNAGMISAADPDAGSGALHDTSLESWRKSLSRNVETAFLVTKAASPHLINRGWGRVVMVASVTGPVMAIRAEVAYAAAKAGMVGFARALAVDLGRNGVTVNAVAPGWIASGSQTDDEHRHGLVTPLGRSGTPAEVAAVIAWLCSPGASYLTGQCLTVDGGNSIAEER